MEKDSLERSISTYLEGEEKARAFYQNFEEERRKKKEKIQELLAKIQDTLKTLWGQNGFRSLILKFPGGAIHISAAKIEGMFRSSSYEPMDPELAAAWLASIDESDIALQPVH